MTEHSMTENPRTENPMTEDLLTRITRETNERLTMLRGAVEESDRLQEDFRALDAQPEMQWDDLGIEDADSGMREANLDAEEADPGIEGDVPVHSADTPCSPVRRQLPRTRTVSPKVTRLMHSPRRPLLERQSGARRKRARVHSSTGEESSNGLEVDLFPEDGPTLAIDEVDMEAQRYERSI
jgi:hypothetical protein